MAAQTLELFDGTNTFTFDIEGDWDFRQERETRDNATQTPGSEPAAVLKRFSEIWTVERALIALQTTAVGVTATDNAALWVKINALLAHLEDRSTNPITHARIRGADAGIKRTLGGPVFQLLSVTDVEFLRVEYPEIAPASAEVVLQVNLTIEAERVFPDADSIVDIRQVLRYTYEAGLQRVEWETEIETAEGTNAETLARSFGAIPVADFGLDYWVVTSGTDGVNVEVLDADERTTARGSSAQSTERIPTRVKATSVIQQAGKLLGASSGVEEPSVVTEVETNRFLKRTTRTARARGTGGLTFVNNQSLANPTVTIVRDEPYGREYERVWIKEEVLLTIGEVSAVLTGGHKDIAFRPLTGNKRPVIQVGPFQPWELRVEVRVEALGVKRVAGDMLLPPMLADPWVLIPNESDEHAFPRRLEPSAVASQQKWERVGRYVYRTNTDEGGLNLTAVAQRLLGAATVKSVTAPGA